MPSLSQALLMYSSPDGSKTRTFSAEDCTAVELAIEDVRGAALEATVEDQGLREGEPWSTRTLKAMAWTSCSSTAT